MAKKTKLKSRFKKGFGINALIVGALAIFGGLGIYKYITMDWLYQSYQELIGFGLISIIAGLVYLFLGRKSNI